MELIISGNQITYYISERLISILKEHFIFYLSLPKIKKRKKKQEEVMNLEYVKKAIWKLCKTGIFELKVDQRCEYII